MSYLPITFQVILYYYKQTNKQGVNTLAEVIKYTIDLNEKLIDILNLVIFIAAS